MQRGVSFPLLYTCLAQQRSASIASVVTLSTSRLHSAGWYWVVLGVLLPNTLVYNLLHNLADQYAPVCRTCWNTVTAVAAAKPGKVQRYKYLAVAPACCSRSMLLNHITACCLVERGKFGVQPCLEYVQQQLETRAGVAAAAGGWWCCSSSLNLVVPTAVQVIN
jgi:hypothetical protein